MTTKDKILRDTTSLRHSIQLDAVERANRAWSEDDRTEVLEFAVQCALDLKEVIERLAVAACPFIRYRADTDRPDLGRLA